MKIWKNLESFYLARSITLLNWLDLFREQFIIQKHCDKSHCKEWTKNLQRLIIQYFVLVIMYKIISDVPSPSTSSLLLYLIPLFFPMVFDLNKIYCQFIVTFATLKNRHWNRAMGTLKKTWRAMGTLLYDSD